jgi:hypothetical protein
MKSSLKMLLQKQLVAKTAQLDQLILVMLISMKKELKKLEMPPGAKYAVHAVSTLLKNGALFSLVLLQSLRAYISSL